MHYNKILYILCPNQANFISMFLPNNIGTLLVRCTKTTFCNQRIWLKEKGLKDPINTTNRTLPDTVVVH